LTASTTVDATGNITGGNVSAGSGIISTTGNINGGNVNATANVTGTGAVFSGNVTAQNFIGNITGNIDAGGANTNIQFNDGDILNGSAAFTFDKTSNAVIASGNITGGNLTTTGVTSTGSLTATTTINATGNITGGNVDTAGQVVATGNITGGNLTTTGVTSTGSLTASTTINATGNITGGNLTTTGITSTGSLTATTTIAATGNITGGNLTTTGITSTGSLTATTTIAATGNITGGNLSAGSGIISTTGNVNGDNVNATALVTGANVTATANVTGANVVGTTSVTGGNIVITGDDITDTNGRVNFNTAGADVDFAVNGDTVANVFYVDAGTGTASFGTSTQTTNALVAFNTSTSVLMPVGNTAQRPGTGVTGMLRFNSTTDSLEIYNNAEWTSVGVPVFTVIADEQFNGDGSTVVFTLGSEQTTASCIVSINGVVQLPTISYSVTGTTLTFTEAPQSGDVIDVRQITTTTSVTSISNTPGSAIIQPNATLAQTDITGNLIPTANVTFDLGNSTNRWRDGYFSGSSLILGNVVMKNVAGGNSIGFFGPDGTTPATIAASSIDTTQIANGTSSLAVIASGGNIRANVSGATVGTFYSSGLSVPGIINSGANGVGNIGSASGFFNTVFAKATSAQYADLAEKYVADAEYAPGTVVVFGGDQEVTVSTIDADRSVAGVVSTNPSYIMNAGLEAEHVATVALTGRVPTRVTGTVCKGDLMVSAGNGVARAEADPRVGTVIGKALENHEGTEGVIEVVVGRF
jgi:filamentous hemagglutinin